MFGTSHKFLSIPAKCVRETSNNTYTSKLLGVFNFGIKQVLITTSIMDNPQFDIYLLLRPCSLCACHRQYSLEAVERTFLLLDFTPEDKEMATTYIQYTYIHCTSWAVKAHRGKWVWEIVAFFS